MGEVLRGWVVFRMLGVDWIVQKSLTVFILFIYLKT